MAAARKEPRVRIGNVEPNGICASMVGLIERGSARRPRVARELRGRIELRFRERFAPIRIDFGDGSVLVEDAPAAGDGEWRADLVIEGSLPDVVQLASAPLVGGVPSPTHARGRAALARMASRRVRIEGSPRLARRLLKLLEI